MKKAKAIKTYKVMAALFNPGGADRCVQVGGASGPYEDGTFNIRLETLPVMASRWNGALVLVPNRKPHKKAGT